MAFEGLTERLQNAIGKLRRKGKISEADVKEVMREIRLALLEADVNFKVVKDFVKTVRSRAIGAEVLDSLYQLYNLHRLQVTLNEFLAELP